MTCLLDELKAYTGFEESDSALLARITLSEAQLMKLLDRFYHQVMATPQTRRLVSNPETLARLRQTLHAWVVLLFSGPHDQTYFDKRQRIGQRHVEIGLEHHHVSAAMAVLREELVVCVHALVPVGSSRTQPTLRAMHKLLDIELAIMMETYQEERLRLEMLREMQEHRRQSEEKRRLATIGQMVAGIAHEIRTPMQVLTTSFEALPGNTAALDRGRLALRQMQDFIQEILDYAKEVQLDLAPVDTRTLVASALSDLTELITRTDVTICTSKLSARERILADPFRLKQVFVNLLRNGIEATQPGGRIWVEAREAMGRSGPFVAFVIRDEGRGIPSADMEKLFVPFFTTKPRGTGLGLPIVQRLVHAHGGQIEVSSEPEQGTQVVVRIPAAVSAKGTA